MIEVGRRRIEREKRKKITKSVDKKGVVASRAGKSCMSSQEGAERFR